MKNTKFFLILVFASFLSLNANASECTDYLVNMYSKEYNAPIKFNSKKEHIDKYEQMLGTSFVSSIVYGVGYMKKPDSKKMRVTYVCAMENDQKPIWGYVIPR